MRASSSGKLPSGALLIRNQHRLVAIAAPLHLFAVAGELRERRHLRAPAGAVIVLGVALRDAVRVRRHPVDVGREPALHARQIGRLQVELPGGARHFHQVQRVDDPDAPPGEAPLDGLRVLQVRVHARGLVHKPGAQVRGGMLGVLAIFGDLVRRGQRGHRQAEADHGAPVLHEVIRIGHAVALYVGPLRIRRVGPPVIAFAEEIVLARRRFADCSTR